MTCRWRCRWAFYRSQRLQTRVSAYCSFGPRYFGSADTLQCEPVSDALVDDASQLLGQRDARVPRGERRQLREPFGNLAGTGKQLVGRHNFVDRAPFLGRLGIELLAGEDEVAAPYRGHHFPPPQMEPTT